MSYRRQRSRGYTRSHSSIRGAKMPAIAKGLPSMTPQERAKYPYDFCPDCEAAFMRPTEPQKPKTPAKQPKVVELRGQKRKGEAPPQEEKKKEETKAEKKPEPGKGKGAPEKGEGEKGPPKPGAPKPEEAAKPSEPQKAKGGEPQKKPEEKPPKKPALPFDVDKNDVKKALKGADDVKQEFKKATAVKKDETTPQFMPVAGTVSASMYRDNQFMSKMNSSLHDWRSGYVEKIGKKGSRLDIREYVRSKGKEPFITRLKRSARGRKILVIADFSGSMQSRQEDYKTALINGLEVLNSIGSRIALFGFGAEQRGTQEAMLFKVKKFEEPQWNLSHSAKVASLLANYPNTPLGGVYYALSRYIKMHRPHVTLTVTDGSPYGDPRKADVEIAKLKKSTKMVAFGIGDSAEYAKRMEQGLKTLGYNKVFAVSSMSALPEKMVRLLAPER